MKRGEHRRLREAQRGKSCGEINLSLPERLTFRGCWNVTCKLREEGYIEDVYMGESPCVPYVMQGGFQITSEPLFRGRLTPKGEAALAEIAGK